MDVTLPNGYIITNVPNDISRADLKAKLLNNGFTEKDFVTEKEEATTSNFPSFLRQQADAALIKANIDTSDGIGILQQFKAGTLNNNESKKLYLESQGYQVSQLDNELIVSKNGKDWQQLNKKGLDLGDFVTAPQEISGVISGIAGAALGTTAAPVLGTAIGSGVGYAAGKTAVNELMQEALGVDKYDVQSLSDKAIDFAETAAIGTGAELGLGILAKTVSKIRPSVNPTKVSELKQSVGNVNDALSTNLKPQLQHYYPPSGAASKTALKVSDSMPFSGAGEVQSQRVGIVNATVNKFDKEAGIVGDSLEVAQGKLNKSFTKGIEERQLKLEGDLESAGDLISKEAGNRSVTPTNTSEALNNALHSLGANAGSAIKNEGMLKEVTELANKVKSTDINWDGMNVSRITIGSKLERARRGDGVMSSTEEKIWRGIYGGLREDQTEFAKSLDSDLGKKWVDSNTNYATFKKEIKSSLGTTYEKIIDGHSQTLSKKLLSLDKGKSKQLFNLLDNDAKSIAKALEIRKSTGANNPGIGMLTPNKFQTQLSKTNMFEGRGMFNKNESKLLHDVNKSLQITRSAEEATANINNGIQMARASTLGKTALGVGIGSGAVNPLLAGGSVAAIAMNRIARGKLGLATFDALSTSTFHETMDKLGKHILGI
jgi:hypothetical protein